jgi:ribosomal protein L40E
MRWSLWHSPSKLIRQRDIVYLEYMDTFVDERGRRGWARMTQSLEHRSCPPLMGSHNIVRAFLHCCGTVYTETADPKVLKAVTYYDADTQGVPPWMTKIVANRKAKNPHNLEHLIRLEHVMKAGMDPDSSFQERHLHTKLCAGCNAMLPKWGRHRKCRDCSEVGLVRCLALLWWVS